MTLFFNIGGVGVPAETVRLVGGIGGLTTVADGSVGTGTWEVDDPAGAYSFLDLQLATVSETACSQPRMHTGYIYNVTQKRGPYKTGPGKVWTFDIGDLNFLLHLRVLRGATAKRPQESGTARINWLLSSVGLSGLVYDHGMIGTYAITFTFDVADYTGQYADEVLQNIVAESGTLGRIFFVYRDVTTGQPSLFFMSPAAAFNDSTLRISNVLADKDSVTFQPQNAELAGAGEDIYDGVLVDYTGGKLYKQLASTYTTFGLHRDGTLSTSRINNLTTATARADQYLYRHSGQLDTITCVVQLPAASVNLIDAGMRVQVKFSHLTGYTTFQQVRVTRRTVVLSSDTNDYYDVQLELSIKGINQTGGGSPGTLPFVGCTSGSMGLVQLSAQASTVSNTVVLPATPIVGNILLWFEGCRSVGAIWAPTVGSWTLLDSTSCDQNLAGDYPTRIYYKFVEATDTTTFTLNTAPSGAKGWMVEFSGQLTAGTSNKARSSANVGLVSVTPTIGKVALLVSLEAISDDSITWPRTPATGMTEIVDDPKPGPQLAINYQVVASTTGSYSVGSTEGSHVSAASSVIGGVFYCSGSDNPVGQGQWVFDEVPTPTPDGTTTTFTFANAFADGSMRVKVDLLDQTASISSYDGAAKTVTMLFAPKVGEKLTGTYQGR